MNKPDIEKVPIMLLYKDGDSYRTEWTEEKINMYSVLTFLRMIVKHMEDDVYCDYLQSEEVKE
jgi:hypothetical protein